jgi:hypothetical protein
MVSFMPWLFYHQTKILQYPMDSRLGGPRASLKRSISIPSSHQSSLIQLMTLCFAFMLGAKTTLFWNVVCYSGTNEQHRWTCHFQIKSPKIMLLNMKSKRFLMLIYLYTYRHRLYITSRTAFNSKNLQTYALSFVHQHCIYSILSGMLVTRTCMWYWTNSLRMK